MTPPPVQLESPLPNALPAGSATALFLSGSAAEGALELLIGDRPLTPRAQRMPRLDLPARRRGFWALAPVRMPSAGVLRVEARLGTRTFPLGEIGTLAPVACGLTGAEAGAGAGPVAVCLATYEPDAELLGAQLDSLRAQSERNWTCVISDDHSSAEGWRTVLRAVGDDPRFLATQAPRRLGFYRNFERALRLVPPHAPLVALCDQDDVWHPEKLAVLRGALGDAQLAFSDCRVVDRAGRVLSETMWRGRRPGGQDLASLLVANWVTGAAALMRREVVELALPFPDTPGFEFHDAWLAMVALASGRLAYVERPLYDYVQHPGAVLGKLAGEEPEPGARERGRAAYFLGLIPAQMYAVTLRLRLGDRLEPAHRRALRLVLGADRAPLALAWLLLRPLWSRGTTLATEWELARGAAWRLCAGVVARLPWWPGRWRLDTALPHPPLLDLRRLRRWRTQITSARPGRAG